MKTPSAGAALSRDPIITTCPGCGAFVKLPSSVNIEAMVQCPGCNDRYPVRSLLPDSIPELIVVRDEGDSTRKQQSWQVGGTEAASQMDIVASVPSLLEVSDILRNGSRRRRRKSGKSGGESPNRDSSRSPNGESGKGGRKKSPRNRTSHAWAEESKRNVRPRKPLVEFIKIMLGGLLALPVAQVIIWWMIGMDPLQIAPTVSRFTPFIVPAKLQQAEPPQKTAGELPEVQKQANR